MPLQESALRRRHGQVRRTRRLVASLAALCLVLLSAGCGEDNPAPSPLSQSESPSPTASASADAAPTLPAAARGTSKKAAVAFVRYAIEVLNYSARTLETEELRDITAPECAACTRIIQLSRRVSRDGGQIVGGEWTPVHMLVKGISTTRSRQVQATVEYSPQVFRATSESKPERYPGGRTIYFFDLVRPGSEWRIGAIRGVD